MSSSDTPNRSGKVARVTLATTLNLGWDSTQHLGGNCPGYKNPGYGRHALSSVQKAHVILFTRCTECAWGIRTIFCDLQYPFWQFSLSFMCCLSSSCSKYSLWSCAPQFWFLINSINVNYHFFCIVDWHEVLLSAFYIQNNLHFIITDLSIITFRDLALCINEV